MDAAQILARLRARGAAIWRLKDDRVAVAPRSALDDGLRAALIAHKPDLLAALELESSAIPIVEARPVRRSASGVEVVEIQPVDPSGPTRWEKRLVQGACALVGEVTTDATQARLWVETLEPADSGDKGAA